MARPQAHVALAAQLAPQVLASREAG